MLKIITGKIAVVLMVFNLLSVQGIVYGNGIDWNRFDYGMIIGYQLPLGDFGEYWGGNLALGGVGSYSLDENVAFSATVSFGRMFPNPPRNDLIFPRITLVELSAGMNYSIYLSSRVGINLSSGGSNFTFIFSGEPAGILQDNSVESEVGVYGGAGLLFDIPWYSILELYLKHNTILSAPQFIYIWQFGVKVAF